MDESSTDLIMRFVMKGGQDVLAECALDKAEDDDLMDKFEPSDYDTYSNFFEITDFDFGIEVDPEERSQNALSQTQRPMMTSGGGIGGTSRLPQQQGGQNGRGPRIKQDEWSRWRSVPGDEYKKIAKKYQVDAQKMSFSRVIDRASPLFFESCCNSKPFDKAVIVKRVSRGMVNGKSLLPISYLKIEFGDVLITGVDWTDGDLVKEKIEFICRKIDIILRQQGDDGSVTKKGQQTAKWERKVQV